MSIEVKTTDDQILEIESSLEKEAKVINELKGICKYLADELSFATFKDKMFYIKFMGNPNCSLLLQSTLFEFVQAVKESHSLKETKTFLVISNQKNQSFEKQLQTSLNDLDNKLGIALKLLDAYLKDFKLSLTQLV